MNTPLSRRTFLVQSGLVGLSTVAMPFVQTASAAGPITFKLGHSGSQEWQGNRWAIAFADALTKKAPDVKVSIFPNAQLGQDPALAQAVKLGTLDITVNGPVLDQYVPSLGVMDLPFLYATMDDAHRVQDGAVGAKIKADCESAGFHFLGWVDIGMRSVTNNRHPINTAADFNGLKLRVPPGKIFVSTFQALGASVQSINFGELYTALQQGVVDGEENPPTTIRVQKYYEVQKYLSLTRHIASFAFVVMNKRTYDRQPGDIKAAIDEAGRAATENVRDFVAHDEQQSTDFLKQNGMVVNTASDLESFRTATKQVVMDAGPVLEPLVKQILAKG